MNFWFMVLMLRAKGNVSNITTSCYIHLGISFFDGMLKVTSHFTSTFCSLGSYIQATIRSCPFNVQFIESFRQSILVGPIFLAIENIDLMGLTVCSKF